MPRPAGTLRERRKTETRQVILKAAVALFADQGFGSTTMDEVAEAAGVSKGLIFHAFGSKADLYEGLLSRIGDQILATIETAEAGLEGFDALEAVSGALLVLVTDNPSAAQLLMGELYRSGRPWQKTLDDMQARVTAPLATILAQTYAERRRAGIGTARDITTGQYEIVAQSIIGALLTAGLDHHRRDPNGSVDALRETLMIAISGLRPEPER